MSDLVNALNSVNRSSGVLDRIANPNSVNPANALTNALTTVAMLKFLSGQGGGGAVRPVATQGNVDYFGSNPLGRTSTGGTPVVPIGADGKPATTTNPAATTPAASSYIGQGVADKTGRSVTLNGRTYVPTGSTSNSSNPGWFIPQATASNQGGSVYVGPTGQHYLDTGPGTLPYSGWQQPAAGSANANAMTTPTAAYTDVATAVLKDPSDASIHTAFTALHNSGFGVFSDFERNQLLAMSPDQRRAWAQQQLQPQTTTPAPTVSIPSNATDIVRDQLNRFRTEGDTDLNVSPY